MKTYLFLLLFFGNFLTKAQTATIYFLRPDMPSSYTWYNMHLLINAEPALVVKNGRVAKIELAPGEYILQGAMGNAKPTKPKKFIFLANESYYFLFVPDELLELTQSTGIDLLEKCRPNE